MFDSVFFFFFFFTIYTKFGLIVFFTIYAKFCDFFFGFLLIQALLKSGLLLTLVLLNKLKCHANF